MELYLNYDKKQDIHGTVLYPALMIAPLQFDILSSIAKENHLKILDPFHGSGVSLYEAAKLNKTYEIYGFDINPLANLITKSKLLGVDSNIERDIKFFEESLYSEDYKFEIHSFPNINKWYKTEIILQLSKLRYAISQVKSYQNRIFFWVMFSNIVRKFSNTRSSTYKLHIKTQTQISNIKPIIFNYFISQCYEKYCHYQTHFSNYIHLRKVNSLIEMSKYPDSFFDIIITSPPYGDNKTTVPYGQFSTLALYWINNEDIECEGWELSSYSAIDSESMGGKANSELYFTSYQKHLIEGYIRNIRTNHKRKKVLLFIYDYFNFLDEIVRINKQYLILTLGNRTVDKVSINLTEITQKYLEQKDYECNDYIVREIQKKRTPRKVSRVDENSVESINNEILIVMKRKDQNTNII